jgi:hypothetical protein
MAQQMVVVRPVLVAAADAVESKRLQLEGHMSTAVRTACLSLRGRPWGEADLDRLQQLWGEVAGAGLALVRLNNMHRVEARRVGDTLGETRALAAIAPPRWPNDGLFERVAAAYEAQADALEKLASYVQEQRRQGAADAHNKKILVTRYRDIGKRIAAEHARRTQPTQ